MKRTYSLAEVADQALPAEWTDGVRWLRRRLNRGELTGYRVGRTWRMDEDDVANLIAKHRNTTAPMPVAVPDIPRPLSFTQGSRRRSA